MRLPKELFENVKEPRNGNIVLLIGLYMWGSGKSVAAAYEQIKKEGYRKGDLCLAFHCHPDTFVNGVGEIVSPTGTEAKKVATINKRCRSTGVMIHEVY
jgi:hypothetical protein